MTENPSKYNLAAGKNSHHTNDIGDAIKWLDTLIEADEADVLEILENALWHLSNHAEGEATFSTEELLERLRGAISRHKGQIIDSEIELRLGDDPLVR